MNTIEFKKAFNLASSNEDLGTFENFQPRFLWEVDLGVFGFLTC